MLNEAIKELMQMIQHGSDCDEIKDRARRLSRGIPAPRYEDGGEYVKIPSPKSRKGYSYFTDDEYELANGSSMDDLTLHQTADLIGLAYDAIEDSQS